MRDNKDFWKQDPWRDEHFEWIFLIAFFVFVWILSYCGVFNDAI